MAKRIIELSAPEAQTETDVFTDRIPLDELKKIWGKKSERYTDKQLLKIRDFGYVLCEAIYSIIKRQQSTTIALNYEPVNEGKESNTLRPRKYRRAS